MIIKITEGKDKRSPQSYIINTEKLMHVRWVDGYSLLIFENGKGFGISMTPDEIYDAIINFTPQSPTHLPDLPPDRPISTKPRTNTMTLKR